MKLHASKAVSETGQQLMALKPDVSICSSIPIQRQRPSTFHIALNWQTATPGRCRFQKHRVSIVCWLQRADTALADRLAGFCTQWLSGEDARMARAAAQTMGIFAAVEGARFSRRIPALLTIILPVLQRAAQEVNSLLVLCFLPA